MAQLIRQFGVGLTFSSHVFEDCCIYSAEDANGATRLILHNRCDQPTKISLKFLSLNRKTKGNLIALNHNELAEKVVEIAVDKNQSIEIPAESVYLLMIPAQ